MTLKLDKKEFIPFLQTLTGHYDLYGPVRLAEGVSAYKKIDRPEEVNFDLLNPQKPVKEVFFPQSEVMFCFRKAGKKNEVSAAEEVQRERIILGARPCDIEAVSLIEEVYCGKEYTDVYFKRKREATTIVGMACGAPVSTCFCASTGGGPFVRKGSDLFFIDLGDAYLVELITEKGERFRDNRFFKNASSEDLALAKEIEKKAIRKLESSSGHALPVAGIDKKLEGMLESPLWANMHEKCIGCSTCTFLCPTCHCFDITDEASGSTGQRVRNWDSCLSSLYSLETSGHNPRSTGRERTRQRIMHKLSYFPKLFGKLACVGCGRCILYCPVNFDIRQAIEEIQKEPVSK
jgi:NAD-dependent dihydropyrimidine dehydrogenase PreA subunit